LTDQQRNIGLILSGGGSRGAYQIGVWEALKEIDFVQRIHTISGVSIGAVNGAVIIQESSGSAQQSAIEMWKEAVPGNVFNAVPDGLRDLEWKDYLDLGIDSLKNFKVRVDPFINRLFENTTEEIIRQSPIHYIIAAWNLTILQTEIFPLEKIAPGKLPDYIFASASFPAFGPHKIGTMHYLDGGIGNNLPLDLALDQKQVKKGLAIDVGSFVRYRPSQMLIEKKYKDRSLILRPSKSIPSPVNFSQRAIQEMLEVGYEDGRKNLEKIQSFFEE
jgi:NTE family protein